ncbi:MAG TPA: hypothetical protein VIY52_00235 [Streptosporangiaceae bacterium]
MPAVGPALQVLQVRSVCGSRWCGGTWRWNAGRRDASSRPGRADWPGALAGVAALAAITYAILVLPGAGVTSPQFAVAAVLAVVSSAAFAVTERRGSHPMLPPVIFAPAQFRAANAVTFVVNGALGGFAFVFIPALEIIAGYSPVVAGSLPFGPRPGTVWRRQFPRAADMLRTHRSSMGATPGTPPSRQAKALQPDAGRRT